MRVETLSTLSVPSTLNHEPLTIRIHHTNDFHNHLSDAQAARLSTLRRELGDGGLLLDAGDAISSGNVTYRPGGEPILDMMSEIGYDAMTVGNREFHFSRAGFFTKLNRARFPVLCANVRSTDPGEIDLPVKPWINRIVGGIRITIFGLTVPMITARMLVRKVSSFVFEDPMQTAEVLVPALRRETDLLICLSHLGLTADHALAARYGEIDLIIGGHTHALLPEGERVGSALIVQAGWWGHYLGTVDVQMQQGKPVFTAKIEPL